MFRTVATSAAALIAGATTALADVTPTQVWESLSAYYTGYGYDVRTGDTDEAGDTFTATDIVLTQQAEGGGTTITIPRMTFRATGDANVRAVIEGDMTLESTYQIPAPDEIDAPAGDGATGEGTPADGGAAPTGPDAGAGTGPADAAPDAQADGPADGGTPPRMITQTVTGTLATPGNELLVSGAPGDMLYRYDYPTLDMQLQVPVDDSTTMPVALMLTGAVGSQRVVDGPSPQTTFDMTADRLEIAATGTPPADAAAQGTLQFNAALTDLVSSASSVGASRPDGMAFDLTTQLPEALSAGLAFDGKLAFGAMEASFDYRGTDESGADQSAAGSARSASTDFAFALDQVGLAYSASSTDTTAEMTVSSLPFPISYAIEKASGAIRFPVVAAGEPQDFRVTHAIAGLTLADGVWDMIDPQNRLPRDPASLTVDLEGKARVNQSLFDPNFAQGASAQMPIVPQSVTINQVSLDAVGAKADVTGALTLPEGGAGQPVGTVEGRFEGLNGLLDALVAMGLVPPERQAMGRMMLGMFAAPVEGNPDAMTTRIEFREDGSVLANGQQVR